jgi:hypothetical protein
MFGTKILATTAAALICSLPLLASAQTDDNAGVVTTVNGDATLFRAAAATQPVSLHMRDEIFLRDRIHTQPRSLVRVLLGGKALVTVRELSVLTITEEAGRVTVDLQSGKVGVAVVKSRMRPGEVIEIHSPNATAAVRGTVFVVEVDPVPVSQPSAAPDTTTRVHLFHGALDVSARLDPAQAPVRLAELQSVVVTGNVLGSVRPISRDAVAALTADLKPSQVQTPDAPADFTSGLVAREQGRAVALATSLLAPAPTGPIQGTLKNVKGTVKGVTSTVTTLTGATAETLEKLMDTLGLGDVAGTGILVQGVGDTVGTTVNNTVGIVNTTVGGVAPGLGGALGNVTGGLGGAGTGGPGGAGTGGLGGVQTGSLASLPSLPGLPSLPSLPSLPAVPVVPPVGGPNPRNPLGQLLSPLLGH